MIATQFAKSGTDKWQGIAWRPTAAGNPVITDTLMWLDCDIWAEHEAGDHLMVIGRVSEMSPREWHGHEPLLYFKGRTPQREIRATVTALPFKPDHRRVDVTTLIPIGALTCFRELERDVDDHVLLGLYGIS